MTLLAGVTVVDQSGDSLVSASATSVLAALGADVVVIERDAAGGAARRVPPRRNDGVSASFIARCRGKRWVLADDRTSLGRRAVTDIAAASDVVILDDPSSDLRGRCGSVLATPFGSVGPRSGWRASAIGVFHAAGPGAVTPRAPQESESDEVAPAAPRGHVAAHYAAVHVATTAVALVLANPSPPVDVELSMQEALLPLVRRELAAWTEDGYRAGRRERLWRVAPSGFYRTSDGWVYVNVVEDHQWVALCRLIGRPDLAADARLTAPEGRFEHLEVLDAALAPWFSARRSSEVFELSGAARVPIGPALGPRELLASEHAAVRRVADRSHDGARFPGVPIRPVGREAFAIHPEDGLPAPGRDTSTVLGGLGWSEHDCRELHQQAGTRDVSA